MFAQRFLAGLKKEKKVRVTRKADVVAEQVKQMLRDSDQKLILMVRG